MHDPPRREQETFANINGSGAELISPSQHRCCMKRKRCPRFGDHSFEASGRKLTDSSTRVERQRLIHIHTVFCIVGRASADVGVCRVRSNGGDDFF